MRWRSARTGRLLATAGDDDNGPAVGHRNRPTPRPTPHRPQRRVAAVAFSPDGKPLATGGNDATVRRWDTATGQPHGPPLTGHTGTVWWVAFSPDGKLLASGGGDGTVRLWDTVTGQPHGPPLTGHTGAVNGVAFSPDGALLASASSDTIVRLWKPAFDSWLETGCALIDHNLSMADWNQIAPALPYERTCPNLPSGTGAPSNADAAEYQD